MWILYLFACILRPICLPLPEASIVLFGGLYCDSMTTFLLGVLGSVIGFSIMYVLAKRFMEFFLKKEHIRKNLVNFQSYIKNYRFFLTGVLFVVPVFPDMIICIGAATFNLEYPLFLITAICSKAISIGLIAFSATLGNYLSISKYLVILIEIAVVCLMSVIMRIAHKGEV